ncbi:MAG: response regulator transcription factor [Chloroflexi bacterium]|nr:response regulator transcription factor [Chloroflexota bacterium]
MSDLRVLVVADDPLARAGLATLLSTQADCEVVGQIGAGALTDDINVYQPEVVLWDLGWGTLNPPDDLFEQAGDPDRNGVPVVMLLGDDALEDDSLAASVWQTGARGLLLRSSPVERLLAALEATAQGLQTIDPAFNLAPGPAPRSDIPPPLESLTPREDEVLQLVAEGLSNRAIAQRLGISEHTVKFHINAIMTKLNAQSRTEAVVRATRLGLIIL